MVGAQNGHQYHKLVEQPHLRSPLKMSSKLALDSATDFLSFTRDTRKLGHSPESNDSHTPKITRILVKNRARYIRQWRLIYTAHPWINWWFNTTTAKQTISCSGTDEREVSQFPKLGEHSVTGELWRLRREQRKGEEKQSEYAIYRRILVDFFFFLRDWEWGRETRARVKGNPGLIRLGMDRVG